MEKRSSSTVKLFMRGVKADAGNDRMMTLLSTVGTAFCKILNDGMGAMFDPVYIYLSIEISIQMKTWI